MPGSEVSLSAWSDLCGVVLFRLDKDGICLSVSSNVSQFLATDPGRLVGQPLFDLVPPADLREARERGESLGDWDELRSHLRGEGTARDLPLILAVEPDEWMRFRINARMMPAAEDAAENDAIEVLLCAFPAGTVEETAVTTDEGELERLRGFHQAVRKISHAVNNALTVLFCRVDAMSMSADEAAAEKIAPLRTLAETISSEARELTRLVHTCQPGSSSDSLLRQS